MLWLCRAAEILYSLVAGYSERHYAKLDQWYKDVMQLRQNSAELQHHDAITGTAQQSVVVSYLEMWALIMCFLTFYFLFTSDVMKLVKIRIRRMWILAFRIRRMQMRIEEFILSVGT